jgi:hypothetical protein
MCSETPQLGRYNHIFISSGSRRLIRELLSLHVLVVPTKLHNDCDIEFLSDARYIIGIEVSSFHPFLHDVLPRHTKSFRLQLWRKRGYSTISYEIRTSAGFFPALWYTLQGFQVLFIASSELVIITSLHSRRSRGSATLPSHAGAN